MKHRAADSALRCGSELRKESNTTTSGFLRSTLEEAPYVMPGYENQLLISFHKLAL